MKNQFATLIALSGMVLLQTRGASAADAPKQVILVPRAEVVSRNTQVQRFNINLPITSAQISMPLTLTLINGGTSNYKKFAWTRIFLNAGMSGNNAVSRTPSGRMIVDVGSFKGSNIVVLDLTGQLSAGSNVLMVQAAGMPGASLSYELTSQSAAAGTVGPLKLSSVDPPEVPPGGTITVKGTGFVEDSSKDIVSIYNKPCPVSKATATTLDVKTPAGLGPHSYSVDVTVNGVKSNSLSFTVTGVPELGSSAVASMMPGSTFEFSGKNFSKIPSKNVVTISVDGVPSKTATVTSCTANSITITCPEFPEIDGKIQGGINTNGDLSVSVNGVPAAGSMWVSIGVHPMAR